MSGAVAFLASPAGAGDDRIVLDREIPYSRGLRIGKLAPEGNYVIMVVSLVQPFPSREVRLAGPLPQGFPAGASVEPYRRP